MFSVINLELLKINIIDLQFMRMEQSIRRYPIS